MMANDRSQVLGGIRNNLMEHGFDIEWIDYDDRYNAIKVQYASPISTADGIQSTLSSDIPKTMGAFHGAVVGNKDSDTYARMFVFVVESEKPPSTRTGKIRWWIDWSWLPNEMDATGGELEEPCQKVLDTAKVIDDEGAHDIETEFDFY